jgi:hypothetical protein
MGMKKLVPWIDVSTFLRHSSPHSRLSLVHEERQISTREQAELGGKVTSESQHLAAAVLVICVCVAPEAGWGECHLLLTAPVLNAHRWILSLRVEDSERFARRVGSCPCGVPSSKHRNTGAIPATGDVAEPTGPAPHLGRTSTKFARQRQRSPPASGVRTGRRILLDTGRCLLKIRQVSVRVRLGAPENTW